MTMHLCSSFRTGLVWPSLAAALLAAGCGGGGDPVGAAAGASAAAPVSASTSTATPGTEPSAPALSLSAASESVLSLNTRQLPDYTSQLPPHYAGVADNTPAGTQESPVVAALGRVLFYDRQLSFSGTVSCASCHKQDQGFGDTARFSTGFDGVGKTTAHAMRLANVRFYSAATMFWDKRAASLEAQSTLPVQHPVEMGFDASHGGIAALVQRMQTISYYPELFAGAYGDPAITEPRIQDALSMFMRSIVSTSSRWDEAYAQVYDPSLPDKGVNKELPGFTEQENRGRHLFMAPRAEGGQACAACHQPPSFALGGSGSNGLDAGETLRFKSPSLKNVALSGAFMHDGRFSSLEEVVEHYSSGVQDGPALDGRLKGPDGTALKPNLPAQDKAALVAFMKTLSDPVLAADARFGSPFRVDAGLPTPAP
jgi:cytochrome c peroxidase